MWAADMVGWNLCKLGMNVALVSWIYLLGSAFMSSKHRGNEQIIGGYCALTEGADCLWLFLHTAGVIFILSFFEPLTSYLYKCTEMSELCHCPLLFGNAATVICVLCLVAQLCPTLCDPMDHSPPGSSVHGDSPGKNTGVGCHAFLQGILPTQESNLGLPHCRQHLYSLSHQGSPLLTIESESESCSVMSDSSRPHEVHNPWNSPAQNTGVGSLSTLQEIFPTQWLNLGLPHCRQILYWLRHKGSPRILEWAAYLFSSGPSQPRNRTGVSCIAGRFFTNWAMREAPLTISA